MLLNLEFPNSVCHQILGVGLRVQLATQNSSFTRLATPPKIEPWARQSHEIREQKEHKRKTPGEVEFVFGTKKKRVLRGRLNDDHEEHVLWILSVAFRFI